MAKDPRSVAEAVDVHVGQKLRTARKMCGISQAALGTHCGLSFQQIQKFESGAVRVSAGRLLQLSAFLGVPVSFFYDGVEAEELPGSPLQTRVIELSEFSETKSACIKLIAAADDDDIVPVRDMLERLTQKRAANK